MNDAPMFALRLTTLGKGGGCVLACTMHHILADGARIMNSLADLSRAYRGERLQPLGRWLHRDLMFKENIHQLLPGGEALVKEACNAVKVSQLSCAMVLSSDDTLICAYQARILTEIFILTTYCSSEIMCVHFQPHIDLCSILYPCSLAKAKVHLILGER